MDGFARSSSRYAVALLTTLPALSACVEELPPLTGTTSLRVELVSPTELGSDDDRLADDARALTLRLTAIDIDGNHDTGFSGRVDFYAHHLGSLTPELEDGVPLASAMMTGGTADGVALELPRVFGPTFLWAEHASGDEPTFATGTSDTIWYRDPYLADISRPIDEAALDALERSPLERKQVVVTQSRYGASGKLVVTGSYAQGYTLSDVDCSGGAGCVTGDYDSIFVYTFSRPEASSGGPIVRGDVVSRLTGAISEFNGLTEVNFPTSFLAADADPAAIPPPIVIQPEWLDTRIEMERAEAALVALDNATVCALDDDFDTYGQWKLDIGKGCGRPINVITQGQVAEFHPEDHVGATLPRVVGTLRPVNIGSFNVWIVYPRDLDDITTP